MKRHGSARQRHAAHKFGGGTANADTIIDTAPKVQYVAPSQAALGLQADALAPPLPAAPLRSPPLLRALRQSPRNWLLFIGAMDALLLVLAVGVAVAVRYVRDPAGYVDVSQGLAWRSALFAGAVMVGMLALGLYQPQTRETRLGLFSRQVVAFVVGGVMLVVLYYAVPQAYIGRGVLALSIAFGLTGIAGWRLLVMSLMDVEALKRRVLVFGAGERAAFIAQRMRRRSDRRTFSIVGFVPVPGEPVCVPRKELVGVDAPLQDWTGAHQIDEIVVVPDDRRGKLPMEQLLECRQRGVEINDLVRFLERESGKVRLTAPPSWLVFSSGFNASPLRKASKRAFDVACAAVLLALSWPAMLCVALAIRLESGRGQPILYCQDRVGERGRVFCLYKFRSMRTDAEASGVARWASKDDDRVTKVGRVIRKLRLDELPQLWNVLNGSMSLVGPRPERPTFVADLAARIPYYNMRHCVKPGVTGWAQLRYPYGSSVEDAAEKLTFDLFYVKNHNFRFDALILIQTVEVVLFGRGAR